MKSCIRNTAVKAIILSFVACLTILHLLPVSAAAAEPAGQTGIEIQSSYGYQGEVKRERWFPAHFTLTNRTGRELSGELVVSVLSNMNGNKVDYSVMAELPLDTPITLSMAIPANQMGRAGSLIRFYEGTAESGKTVKLLGSNEILAAASGNDMIGIVARDPDTLNFMPMLNQRGYAIKTIPIKPEELPEDELQLDMLDVLLFNDVASDSLSEGQRKAIADWVNGGGMLILSGGAGYEKTAAPFQAIAPVTVQGTKTIADTDSLTSYVGDKKLVLNGSFTASSAAIGEGTALLMAGDTVLAAQRSVGQGKVLYVAFDPSLEPMASWSGSAALWAKLMGNMLKVTQNGAAVHYSGNMPFWELQNAVNMFPSIKNPQFMTLLYLFLVYLLIVAPLLFLLLKRMDRREWAWWIIPSIAIVSSVTIFFVGANDKSKMLAHTIRMVELDGRGAGVQYGASSVFIPAGGDVRLSFDSKQALVPYRSGDASFGGQINDLADNSLQAVTRKDAGTEVRWKDVPYWSTRSTYMDAVSAADTGQLETALEDSDKGPVLRITNRTKVDLTNVHLIWNGQVVKVGDLEIGKSGSALIPVAAAGGQQSYYDYGSRVFPYPSSNNKDTSPRERTLTNAYTNSLMNVVKGGNILPNQLIVLGYSKGTEPLFQVNGQQVKSDSVTLWAQKVAMEVLHGDQAAILPGMINPAIESTTMGMADQRPEGIVAVTKGELVFSYLLPDVGDVQYDKLTIYSRNPNPVPSGVTLSIWNEKQGEWAEVTGNGLSWELQAAADYIKKDRTIQMKFDVSDDIHSELVYPQIGLNGKVKR